jgi:hypothetical protein
MFESKFDQREKLLIHWAVSGRGLSWRCPHRTENTEIPKIQKYGKYIVPPQVGRAVGAREEPGAEVPDPRV